MADRGQDNVAHHSGEGEQDGVVESSGRVRSGDQHEKDQSRTVEAVRLRRRDAGSRREDDVRPAPEGNGTADIRRTKETRYDEKVGLFLKKIVCHLLLANFPNVFFIFFRQVHAATPRNGFQQVQVFLNAINIIF